MDYLEKSNLIMLERFNTELLSKNQLLEEELRKVKNERDILSARYQYKIDQLEDEIRRIKSTNGVSDTKISKSNNENFENFENFDKNNRNDRNDRNNRLEKSQKSDILFEKVNDMNSNSNKNPTEKTKDKLSEKSTNKSTDKLPYKPLDKVDKPKIKTEKEKDDIIKKEYEEKLKANVFLYEENTSEKNKELVKSCAKSCNCKNDNVINILRSIDRVDFILEKDHGKAYSNNPIFIGWGESISAPYMHMFTTNYVSQFAEKLRLPAKILDIGCGSGFITLAMSKLFGSDSITYSLDHIQEIVDFANKNISKNHKAFIDTGRIKFVCMEGDNGYPESGPYHFIHVGASFSKVPQQLLDQLALGGLLWIPIGHRNKSKKILAITKDEDGTTVTSTIMEGVNLSEMRSAKQQLSEK